jgi:hypothetical protein
MITVSNDNKNRVDAAIDKQLTQCFNLISEASVILHDTGDTESIALDNAMWHLQRAVELVTRYRESGDE